MNSKDISELLKKGIAPNDPRFPRELDRLAELRKVRPRLGFLSDARMIFEAATPATVHAWLAGEGRGIRLGPLLRVEVWERGSASFLVVQKGSGWEAYNLRAHREGDPMQIAGRII